MTTLAFASESSAGYFFLWALLELISILLHEMGHAWAARRYGSDSRILLYGMGGLTFHHATSPLQQIAIALAGPAAGFVLGTAALIGWLLLRGIGLPPLATYVLWALMWINLGWGLANLLPVLPLDGGIVLDNLLGSHRRRTTFTIGAIVALVACAVGLLVGIKSIAILFGFLLVQNGLNWWMNRPRFARQLRRAPRKPKQVDPQHAQAAARTAIEQLRE